MIMMNGDSPVPGSSPTLPVSAALPSSGSNGLEATQFRNGPPLCTGCGQPIRDQFILRLQGHFWHGQCLRCAECNVRLTHVCFAHENQVYCRPDFYRLFGAACSGCGQVIPPTEVVRTAHDLVYHLHCFVCVVCGVALETGDEFYIGYDGKLICRQDYRHAQQQAAATPSESPEGSRQESLHGLQQQQALGNDSSPQETEILNSVYSACPNPSHDMLQRISSQHGLDLARVRTWFHLRRKEREGREEGEEGMETAQAAPGGYPLPIVNEVSSTSSGRLPASSSRSDVMGDLPFQPTSSCSRLAPGAWPLSEDVWRLDFVPPNVDLNPCDIENGEVRSSRRGLPPRSPLTPPVARGQCFFLSASGGKGGNCQQEQQCGNQGPLSWINS